MNNENSDSEVIVLNDNYLSSPFEVPPQNNGSSITKTSKIYSVFSDIKSYIFGDQKAESQDQELAKIRKDV